MKISLCKYSWKILNAVIVFLDKRIFKYILPILVLGLFAWGLSIDNMLWKTVIIFLSISLSSLYLTIFLWSKINEKGAGINDTTLCPWIIANTIIIISGVFIFIDDLLNLINNTILYESCSYNYLLSAINQSLATLFALVFSLMFVLTQISKSKRKTTNKQIGKIFSKYVLIYICTFVIAILAPLFLMGTDNIIGIKIVLFFTVCNVAMLIPFFWRFKITLTRKQ